MNEEVVLLIMSQSLPDGSWLLFDINCQILLRNAQPDAFVNYDKTSFSSHDINIRIYPNRNFAYVNQQVHRTWKTNVESLNMI